MKKLIFIAMAALILVTTFVSAQPKAPDASAKVGSKATDPRIAELLAMSPAERRETLRNLPREERRGLWFAVQQALVANRGGAPAPAAGSGRYDGTGFPLDLGKAKKVPKKIIGTITYDSGFPTIGFGGGAIIGNHFNTHTGIPVLASGTVSTIRALVVPGPANTTSSAGFVLEGPQTVGGGAFAIFSTFTVATGVIDSLTFSGIGASYTGSSFFVLFGDFASVYIPVYGTGTTLAQGHHGVVGYTGGMGPNITSTFDFGGALNSFIRTRGNIVPVELMTFDVE